MKIENTPYYVFVPENYFSEWIGMRLCDDLNHAKALVYYRGGQIFQIDLQDMIDASIENYTEGYPSLYAQQVPLNWSNDNDPTQGQ